MKKYTRHGMSRTRTYNTWQTMIQRCHNPNHTSYYLFGARGITVCKRWRESFINFYKDMGERPEGRTLDRIDPNKSYGPRNCRWATPTEQMHNRRDNVKLTLDGETMLLVEWAERAGVRPSAFFNRYYKGWDDVSILTTPVRVVKPRTRLVKLEKKVQLFPLKSHKKLKRRIAA